MQIGVAQDAMPGVLGLMDSRDLAWLLDVARAGSLSAAAAARGVAVSTATRRIDALETALGVRLVDRRTNGSVLTAAGNRLTVLAQNQVDGAARIMLAAEALRQGGERETVCVSATEFVISDVLAPALPLLHAAQPMLSLTLKSQHQIVSLAARDADIAVRMVRPEGNSLIVRRLADIELGLFAHQSYLGGRDASMVRPDAERLLIYHDSYGSAPEMAWFDRSGLGGAIAVRTASIRALLVATRAGVGIGLLPVAFAERAGLVRIPVTRELPLRTPWLAVHRDLSRHPPIRAVRDWIAAAFKQAFCPISAG